MLCTAKTKRGKPCRGKAIKGIDKCRLHCGQKTTVAKRKGQENIARGKIGELLASLGYDGDADPLLGLIREVGRASMAVEVLGGQVAELEEVHGPNHLGDGAPHILVTMWNEERDRLARYCKLAIDAGIAERQVRVAEAQARMLAGVITAVLEDRKLKLTPKQQEVGKKVAADHLRVLAS